MPSAPNADSGITIMEPVIEMLADTVKSKAGPIPIMFWS